MVELLRFQAAVLGFRSNLFCVGYKMIHSFQHKIMKISFLDKRENFFFSDKLWKMYFIIAEKYRTFVTVKNYP